MAKKILSGKKPERSLLRTLKSRGGRNRMGQITVRHRGGGHKKRYRLVDFGQKRLNAPATVSAIEYDPNRNAHLALVAFEDGSKSYILAPQGLREGDRVLAADRTEVKPGNRMKLAALPVGTQIHNVELQPGRGGAMVRGAGTAATVVAQEGGTTLLELPSKEMRRVPSAGFASVGQVSNPEYRFQRIPNAGRARHMGRRPHVRGSAMNPVDHPHGGGEGRTGIGLRHPKTPWGKPALGVKTRKKKWSDKAILRRRPKKKRK